MSDPKKVMELLTQLIQMKQSIEALRKEEMEEQKKQQETVKEETCQCEPPQMESEPEEEEEKVPDYLGTNVRLGLDVFSNEDGFFINITSYNPETDKEGVLESFKMSTEELIKMRNGIDRTLAKL